MATATVSRNEIKALGGKALVELFNELTGGSVKRFSTRAAGLKRTLAAFDESNVGGTDATVKNVRTNKASTKVDVVPVGDVARKRRLTFPVKSIIKTHRSGTRRATVIKMLSRGNGATVQQVMDEIPEWDYRTAFEGIKLIHAYTGYGLEEDAKGRIRLIGLPTS